MIRCIVIYSVQKNQMIKHRWSSCLKEKGNLLNCISSFLRQLSFERETTHLNNNNNNNRFTKNSIKNIQEVRNILKHIKTTSEKRILLLALLSG